MRIIILLGLLLLTFSLDTTYEKKLGPARNIEARLEESPSCEDRFVIDGNQWYDDGSNDPQIGGKSDCVDLHLWSRNKNRYFDKCCYVRFQVEGVMHSGCVGLSTQDYNDITDTIRRMEEGDRNIWTRNANNSKIYSLDCHSSYLKYFSLALLLLFF
jgi:hypothetical protein